MKFTVCLINYATGEMFQNHVTAKSATHAVNNFRRRMRAWDRLRAGEPYKVGCWIGWVDWSAATDLSIYSMRTAR